MLPPTKTDYRFQPRDEHLSPLGYKQEDVSLIEWVPEQFAGGGPGNNRKSKSQNKNRSRDPHGNNLTSSSSSASGSASASANTSADEGPRLTGSMHQKAAKAGLIMDTYQAQQLASAAKAAINGDSSPEKFKSVSAEIPKACMESVLLNIKFLASS